VKLDVVVVTYESAGHLRACLGCLPGEARTVVVDNCSSDASAAIAEEEGAVVVRNAANTGFAAAANQGAALGDADLILFLNPDAAIPVADLERLVDALRADPTAAVAGPRLVHPDGTDQRPWWPFPSASRSWLEATGLLRLVPERRRRHVPFVVGACLLVRRGAFEAMGGFDETFWLYGEEADLCRRAAGVGWRVRYVPEAVAVHVGAASAEAAGTDVVQEQFLLGTERFIAKHGGRAALVSHRVAVLAGSALRVGVLGARPGHPVGAHRRRLVRRQLRVLVSSPASVPVPAADGTRRADGLVVCSLEPWDDTWRRNQFLVRELLAHDSGLRVLFVEPAADIPHQLARSHRLPGPLGLRQVTPDGRLWALRPRKLAPRAIGPWADRSLMRQVRAAAATLGMSQPTLWVNDTVYAPLLSEPGWPALYDVTDDWIDGPCSSRERRRRRRREDEMLRRAAVVTVCSPALAHRRGGRRPVRVIPNAVDAAHFTRARPRPRDLPDGRCAVYVGTLHANRLDVDLVVELADGLPAGHVVLVGPDSLDQRSRSTLAARPNVHLVGPRPYEDVPGYLQHADVVIVPHVVSPFTESLDPIKAYEILAVGRPAVVTPVAGLRHLGPPTQCAARGHFVEAVRAVLADPPDPAPQAVASWPERAEAFKAALDDTRTADGRLSVVYLDHCAQLSGGEIALLRLLPALEGISAHVILAEDGPLRPRLEALGVECEVLPMPDRARSVKRTQVVPFGMPLGAVFDTLSYTLRLRRRLRELRPDLVHANSLKAGLYGCLAARLAGVPAIWHVRDRIDPDYLPTPAVALVRALVRFLPHQSIANSRSTLESLGPGINRAGRNTAVVHSPVVCTTGAARGGSRQAADGAEFLVGMVGRISPWKGQDVFLRAFADAFPGGDERALVVGGAMFGEGDYEEKLHKLAIDLDIAHRVEFAGFRDNVEELLAQFDVLVHASVIPEPFGQVIVEAMAAGVPVVAARAGGPLEIIENEQSGLLYRPGDVSELSKALRRLRGDGVLRGRLSVNGRVRAQDFNAEAIGAQVVGVYRAVLHQSQPQNGR
jgi:glycosyltransferase involved in cell wall biosynthesis/GT2 family glycosyltransferase